MKVKYPKIPVCKESNYLGHFRQDKFIQKGHNTSAKADMKNRDTDLKFDAAIERLRLRDIAKSQANWKGTMDEKSKSRDSYVKDAQSGRTLPEVGDDADLFAGAYEEKIRNGPITPSKGDRGGARVSISRKKEYPSQEED